jgi:hypothetical protein
MASQQRSAADLFGYTRMRLSATEGQQQILYVTLPRSLVATSQGTRSYGRSGHVQPMRSPFRDAWALAELTSSDSDAGTQALKMVQRCRASLDAADESWCRCRHRLRTGEADTDEDARLKRALSKWQLVETALSRGMILALLVILARLRRGDGND